MGGVKGRRVCSLGGRFLGSLMIVIANGIYSLLFSSGINCINSNQVHRGKWLGLTLKCSNRSLFIHESGDSSASGWALHILQEPVHIFTFSSPPSLSASGLSVQPGPGQVPAPSYTSPPKMAQSSSGWIAEPCLLLPLPLISLCILATRVSRVLKTHACCPLRGLKIYTQLPGQEHWMVPSMWENKKYSCPIEDNLSQWAWLCLKSDFRRDNTQGTHVLHM